MMNLVAQSSRSSTSLMDLLPGRAASNFSADGFGAFRIDAASEPTGFKPASRKSGGDRAASQDAKPVEARADSDRPQADQPDSQEAATGETRDTRGEQRDDANAWDEQEGQGEQGDPTEIGRGDGEPGASSGSSDGMPGSVEATAPAFTPAVTMSNGAAAGATPGVQAAPHAVIWEGVQAGSAAIAGEQSPAASGEQSGEGRQHAGQGQGQGQAQVQAANQRAMQVQQAVQANESAGQNGNQSSAQSDRASSPLPPGISVPTPAVDGAQAGRMPTGELQTVREMLQQDDQANVGRLSRALQSGMAQKGGAITLRLTPPDLGLVRISLQLSDTTVTARFAAQNPEARQMLERSMEQLRASLERQGLVVDRLSVREMPATQSGDGFGASDDPSRWAGDGRSRQRYTRRPPQGDESKSNPGEESRFDEQLSRRIETQQ